MHLVTVKATFRMGELRLLLRMAKIAVNFSDRLVSRARQRGEALDKYITDVQKEIDLL